MDQEYCRPFPLPALWDNAADEASGEAAPENRSPGQMPSGQTRGQMTSNQMSADQTVESNMTPRTPIQPNNITTDNMCPCPDSIDPALLSLAMAFVPLQSWETPYDYPYALDRGTVFESLDKPWIGRGSAQ
jgi:hypothetical protein